MKQLPGLAAPPNNWGLFRERPCRPFLDIGTLNPRGNGAEFASSGEADVAPRDNEGGEELSADVLEAAQQANLVTSRVPQNLDCEEMWQVGDFVVGGPEERVGPEAVVHGVGGAPIAHAEGPHDPHGRAPQDRRHSHPLATSPPIPGFLVQAV